MVLEISDCVSASKQMQTAAPYNNDSLAVTVSRLRVNSLRFAFDGLIRLSFHLGWRRFHGYFHHGRPQQAVLERVAALHFFNNFVFWQDGTFFTHHGLVKVRVEHLARHPNGLHACRRKLIAKLFQNQFNAFLVALHRFALGNGETPFQAVERREQAQDEIRDREIVRFNFLSLSPLTKVVEFRLFSQQPVVQFLLFFLECIELLQRNSQAGLVGGRSRLIRLTRLRYRLRRKRKILRRGRSSRFHHGAVFCHSQAAAVEGLIQWTLRSEIFLFAVFTHSVFSREHFPQLCNDTLSHL